MAVERRKAVGAPAAARGALSFYEIGELLGTGVSGAVHRCTHRETCKEWAVKIVKVARSLGGLGGGGGASSSSPIDAALSEARMLASIRHPGIVHVEDVFKSGLGPDGGVGSGDQLFIVMELVNGGDLFDRVVERGRYPEADA